MGSNTRSEDTIVFFAVNREYTNFDLLIHAIESYISQKQAENPNDRFNFVAFEQCGPLYYADFVYDYTLLINTLKEIATTLSTPDLAGGIFLALTQIIEVFKSVGGKTFRVIVLMDQGTLLKKSTILLQSIMDQVIDFPVFIDFVRINTEAIPQEDLELVKFANSNNGTVYFAKHREDTQRILEELLKKKEILSTTDKIFISPEKEPFFNNLGDNLWIAEEAGDEIEHNVCQICRDQGSDLVKCPNCHSTAHAECLAKWASFTHIGLPNIFRCFSCFRLLQLPREFVEAVQKGTYKKEDFIQEVDQDTYLREREGERAPALVQCANPFSGMPDIPAEENIITTNNSSSGDDDFWNDAGDIEEIIRFCACGALNLPEAKFCNNCGRSLK